MDFPLAAPRSIRPRAFPENRAGGRWLLPRRASIQARADDYVPTSIKPIQETARLRIRRPCTASVARPTWSPFPPDGVQPERGVAAGANPHFFGGTARCRDSQPVTSAGRLWLTSKPCKGGPWPRLRRLTALTGLTGQPSLATKGSTLRSG